MNIRKVLPTILIAAGSMVPMKVGKMTPPKPVVDTFVKMKPVNKLKQAEDMAKTMVLVNDTNFAGGVTTKFAVEDISKLRNTIQRITTLEDYTAPIKNDKNVYIEPFGMFFAKRPDNRPHMGLDIFVSPLAKKPKKPVPVIAPIDGIVISNKKANPNDNIVANCVGLLGVDGKTYMFDHLARPTDYKTEIKMPKVGTIMHKGDSIGYVGRTGETALWHLHLNVQSEEQLAKQKADSIWLDYEAKSPYSQLKGQTDPLNKDEAGLISVRLNEYRKQHLETTDKILFPYTGREKYLGD